MGPQFFQTGMGKKFYEGDFPELIRQLKRLNDNLEVKKPEISLKEVVDKHTSTLHEAAKEINDDQWAGHYDALREPVIIITRYTPEQAKQIPEVVDNEFLNEREIYPRHIEDPIQVIAVLGVMLPNTGEVYISEYSNGEFFTIGGRGSELGTLDKCIKFLKEEFL